MGQAIRGFSWKEELLRRLTDVAVALVMVILLMPIWIIIAVLIKFCSRESILFKQERLGRNGRVFLMLKFRSLREDAPNIPYSNFNSNGSFPYIMLRRIPLGRFLRRSRLDETAQLFNVLCGQMSIVGLRPALPSEEEIVDWRITEGLDALPVGLTGLYQTGGNKALDLSARQALELAQASGQSYWQYWRILGKTIIVVLTAKGAGN